MSIIISKDYQKLSNVEASKISAGQLCAENVMGIKGLWVCTGAPTENNPEGYFWHMNGIYIDKQEALEIIKCKATRQFNDEERFLEGYIEQYNQEMAGDIITDMDS